MTRGEYFDAIDRLTELWADEMLTDEEYGVIMEWLEAEYERTKTD